MPTKPKKTHPLSKSPLAALKEAEAKILAIKPRPSSHVLEHYVGAGVSSYRFLNLSSPQVREFADSTFTFASDDSPSKSAAWAGWNAVWQGTQIYDLLSAATVWAADQPLEDLWKHRKILFSWSTKSDNWALADSMCSIYARLFEAHPKETTKTLETWSRSKNPWQRRMSNVSLFYYSRSRKKLPTYKFAEKLILRQLHDEHYYVQKGVGWALRECWNTYPKQTFALLKKIAGQIPPPAWTAATEKLSVKDKKQLALLRAKSRNR